MQNEVQNRYKSILEKLDYKNLSVFQERYFVNGENLINLLLEYVGKRQVGKTDTVIIEYLTRNIPENENLRWCYYYSFAANLIVDALLSNTFNFMNMETFYLIRVRDLADKINKKIDTIELLNKIKYIKNIEYNRNDIHTFKGKSLCSLLYNLKVGEKLYYADNKNWYVYKDNIGRIWQRYEGISQLFQPNLKMLYNEWWRKGDVFMELSEAIKYFEQINSEKYSQVVEWLKELKWYKEKENATNRCR